MVDRRPAREAGAAEPNQLPGPAQNEQMINCPTCGKWIPRQCVLCPHCEKVLRSPTSEPTYEGINPLVPPLAFFGFVSIAMLFFVLVGEVLDLGSDGWKMPALCYLYFLAGGSATAYFTRKEAGLPSLGRAILMTFVFAGGSTLLIAILGIIGLSIARSRGLI
jgi:hypothetical protein